MFVNSGEGTVPRVSPADWVSRMPHVTSTQFLSYRLLESAGSRAEQAGHRHPGVVTEWEQGEHVAASTCAHQPAWALPGKSGPQPRSCIPTTPSMCCGSSAPPRSLRQGKSLVQAQRSQVTLIAGCFSEHVLQEPTPTTLLV